MKKLIITACILFVSGIIIAGASIAGGAFEPVDLKAQSVEFNASDITAMDIDSVLDRVEIFCQGLFFYHKHIFPIGIKEKFILQHNFKEEYTWTRH